MGIIQKPQGAVRNDLESKKVSVWILFFSVLLTEYLLILERAMLLELHKIKLLNLRQKMIQIVILLHQVVILQMKI